MSASAVTSRPTESTRSHVASPDFEALVRRLTSDVSAPGTCPVLGVTSCTSGEGVSTVAANMATAGARALAGDVLLLEVNILRPSQGAALGIPQIPGWIDALAGVHPIGACIHASAISNLSVLPTGIAVGPRHAQVLQNRIPTILETLRSRFSLVVVDLPPVLEPESAFTAAHHTDGVLLVVEAERQRMQVIERARSVIENSPAKLLGVVLNRQRKHAPNWLCRRL